MPSIFGHSAIAIGIKSLRSSSKNRKTLILCIVCAIIPDADVLGFLFHIPYASPFGHRGFSHSILFSVLLSILLILLFYRKDKLSTRQKTNYFFLFFLCTVSHGLLDGMTTGGMGVEYFFPFNTKRYFLPYRPILVSPIGVKRFFSEWGWKVLKCEFYWTVIPMLIMIILRLAYNKLNRSKN